MCQISDCHKKLLQIHLLPSVFSYSCTWSEISFCFSWLLIRNFSVSVQASSQTPKRALSDSEEDTDEERDFSNLYVNYIPCSILFIVTLPWCSSPAGISLFQSHLTSYACVVLDIKWHMLILAVFCSTTQLRGGLCLHGRKFRVTQMFWMGCFSCLSERLTLPPYSRAS